MVSEDPLKCLWSSVSSQNHSLLSWQNIYCPELCFWEQLLPETQLKGTLWSQTSQHGGQELRSLGLCCICSPLCHFLWNWGVLCYKGEEKGNFKGVPGRRKANELWPCSVVSDSQLHVSCHYPGGPLRGVPLRGVLCSLLHCICICRHPHVRTLSPCVLQIRHHQHLRGKTALLFFTLGRVAISSPLGHSPPPNKIHHLNNTW